MNRIIAALAVTAALSLGACIKVSSTPPTDLPAYVKIMPGGQQVMTMDMGALKAEVFQLSSGTTDGVIAFYRTQAQSDGLAEQPTQRAPSDPAEKQATFADNASGRMLVVVTKPQGAATLVTLTYRPVAAGPQAPANAAS